MPCPFTGNRSRRSSIVDAYSRRSFLERAVAVGGATALSACIGAEIGGDDRLDDVPAGTDDPGTLPDRQHAWNEFLVLDRRGNTEIPHHQIVLGLEYLGEGTPTEDDRKTVESAFRTLERAFQWGTGGHRNETINEGLVFTVGYTPRYFDRFEHSLPESIDLPTPEAVVDELGESDAVADPFDAVVVLNSDYAHVVLAAEQALTGQLGEVNGVSVEETFEGVFDVTERRTGFVGLGLPRQRLEIDAIPEGAPMTMGFKSGVIGNQASEDAVTIPDGPFVGGTTQMVSRLTVTAEDWYEHDEDGRVKRMFSPEHDIDDVGRSGELLTTESGMTEQLVEDLEAHAREHGVVGHSQKLATARDEDFEARILRRSEGVATGDPHPGMNFTSVQRAVADFLEVRKAMDRDDFEEVAPEDNGILSFVETRNRATTLVPPRSKRALPDPE